MPRGVARRCAQRECCFSGYRKTIRFRVCAHTSSFILKMWSILGHLYFSIAVEICSILLPVCRLNMSFCWHQYNWCLWLLFSSECQMLRIITANCCSTCRITVLYPLSVTFSSGHWVPFCEECCTLLSCWNLSDVIMFMQWWKQLNVFTIPVRSERRLMFGHTVVYLPVLLLKVHYTQNQP